MKNLTKILFMFALHYIHKGGINACQTLRAFFIPPTLNYSGTVPPCDDLMVSLPLWCNATGKAVPFFISACNINFLKMHYTENSCACCAQNEPVTAEKIIKSLVLWDDPRNMRKHLRSLMDAYFMHHDDNPEKINVHCTFQVLTDALSDMEVLDNRRRVQQ